MKLSAGPDALLKEKTKQKRQREGYEEGISTTARPASAASFLASEKPVEALGRFTRYADLHLSPSSDRQASGASEYLWSHLLCE